MVALEFVSKSMDKYSEMSRSSESRLIGILKTFLLMLEHDKDKSIFGNAFHRCVKEWLNMSTICSSGCG